MVQPTFAVIDASATSVEPRFRGLAAKYLQWELDRCGARTVAPSDADYVLATVVSPHEYRCLPKALAKAGVQPKVSRRIRQRVILGGQGAMSPAIFDPYVDASCVGEGRSFVQSLASDGLRAAAILPNAWIPGESREIVPDESFPWDTPPTMAEDGIVRVYASRSCQKKCLFCQVGWQTAYAEGDQSEVSDQVESLIRSGRRVNVVTNDAPALGAFEGLRGVEHFSASYSQIREMLERGIESLVGKVRSVRIGVEAPSTRLRRIVGKPIVTEDLARISFELLSSGIGVRWFMISGLPGERDEDYAELRDVVLRSKHDVSKGALQLSFTAFCPDSAAPLCLAPLTDDYWPRFRTFWKWFFEDIGYTRKVQLMRCAAPVSRLEHAMASMCASEEQLRRGWEKHDPPNWRVRYRYRHMARRAFEIYAKRAGL